MNAPSFRWRWRRPLIDFVIVIAAYALASYLLLPAAWKRHEHQKAFAGIDVITVTAQGIPGDPINVGIVGSQADILCAMHAAGWFPADDITLRSSIALIDSVVLNRAYTDAPVSPLFFQGRREDYAFEKPDPTNARRRDHVRFWRAIENSDDGRSVWLGAATYDRGVGFSHYTGQVTHHIAADIDAERNRVIGDLNAAHVVAGLYAISGIGPTLVGKNGGGDHYFTDGDIHLARLVAGCNRHTDSPASMSDDVIVQLKGAMRPLLSQILTLTEDDEVLPHKP